MKHFLPLLVCMLLTNLLLAQAPEYDDLKILFADGKYEKLVDKASGYTTKEKTKKDPLPFMWLSRGLYKISLSGTNDPNYKNAYKDAIGAMATAFKLDKDGTKLTPYQDFVGQFQKSMVELISNEVTLGDLNKAASWVSKYYKITRNPLGAKFLDAAAKFKKGERGTANHMWKEAEKHLTDVDTIETWSDGDKNLLKIGVMQSAECLIAAKQVEKAKTLMDSIAKWFENEEDYRTKYSELFL